MSRRTAATLLTTTVLLAGASPALAAAPQRTTIDTLSVTGVTALSPGQLAGDVAVVDVQATEVSGASTEQTLLARITSYDCPTGVVPASPEDVESTCTEVDRLVGYGDGALSISPSGTSTVVGAVDTPTGVWDVDITASTTLSERSRWVRDVTTDNQGRTVKVRSRSLAGTGTATVQVGQLTFVAPVYTQTTQLATRVGR